MELEASRTFPVIHLRTGSGKEGETMTERKRPLKRLSFPMVAGILTAVLAILYFFGPLRQDEPARDISDPAIPLSAEDGGVGEEEGSAGENASAQAEPAGRTVTLHEAWKKDFSKPITSSPACHEGRVIFGCRDGALYAFSAAGEPLWKHPTSNGIGASPACIDDRVIAANYDGDVFCLDVTSGEDIWSYPMKAKIVSTPQVQGNLVVVGTMEGRLTALDLRSGTKIWSQKLGSGIWANVSIGKAYIIAATTDGSLVKLKHDGSIEWRINTGAGILSSPLCMDDENLVIFGTKDQYIYAYSLSDGDLMWRVATGDEANGSPVTDGSSIYIGSADGNLYALSKSGQLKWKRSLGGAILSRPLIIDDTIYVTSYASKLAAIDAVSGSIIGEYKTGSPIYSSPAHDGRRVFFGSNAGSFYSLWLYGESG
jgi:outer membrane protein assembly factor BamB